MTIDVHYQSANLVKYRTDLTFGWLDLLVAFGGIAGLFLGCSMLSGVEIIYYTLIIIIILVRRVKSNFDSYLSKHSKEFRARDSVSTRRKGNRKKAVVAAAADNVQTVNIRVISLTDIDKNEKESVHKSKARY
jgi:hypothetical protein